MLNEFDLALITYMIIPLTGRLALVADSSLVHHLDRMESVRGSGASRWSWMRVVKSPRPKVSTSRYVYDKRLPWEET